MQTFPGYVHPKSYPETCTSFSHIFFQCLLLPSIRPIFETSNKNWTFIHHIPRTNEKYKEYLSKIIYSNSHISCQRYLKIIHTFLPILPSINIIYNIYKPSYSNSSYSTTQDQNSLTNLQIHRIAKVSLSSCILSHFSPFKKKLSGFLWSIVLQCTRHGRDADTPYLRLDETQR